MTLMNTSPAYNTEVAKAFAKVYAMLIDLAEKAEAIEQAKLAAADQDNFPKDTGPN